MSSNAVVHRAVLRAEVGVGIAQIVDDARGQLEQRDVRQLLERDEDLLDLPVVRALAQAHEELAVRSLSLQASVPAAARERRAEPCAR